MSKARDALRKNSIHFRLATHTNYLRYFIQYARFMSYISAIASKDFYSLTILQKSPPHRDQAFLSELIPLNLHMVSSARQTSHDYDGKQRSPLTNQPLTIMITTNNLSPYDNCYFAIELSNEIQGQPDQTERPLFTAATAFLRERLF